MLAATDESFAHDGINPQRIIDSSRTGSFGFWQMTATGWVGAMLYRGTQSSTPESVSKYSSTSCFRRDCFGQRGSTRGGSYATALRTANDSITRVTPLIIMLTPTKVPIAQTELDGHRR